MKVEPADPVNTAITKSRQQYSGCRTGVPVTAHPNRNKYLRSLSQHESGNPCPTVKGLFIQRTNSGRIRTANKVWQIRETIFSETYVRKSSIARNALRFSPAGLYHLSTEAWAGTGLARMQDFFKAGRQYRETILDYFYDKKVFSSRQWFASDKGAVRWDDAPRFSYQPPSVLEDASNRALRDLLLLFLLNPILLMITFAVFSRQEV